MKFAFIAKHRGIWPAEWLCGALGVSRGGFYAWLTRPRSQRSRSDEDVGAKVRASFLGSDRTYGARRVWHDLLAEGVRCGLHRIERLMRQQARKARPRPFACAAGNAPAAATRPRFRASNPRPWHCGRFRPAAHRVRAPVPCGVSSCRLRDLDAVARKQLARELKVRDGALRRGIVK